MFDNDSTKICNFCSVNETREKYRYLSKFLMRIIRYFFLPNEENINAKKCTQ